MSAVTNTAPQTLDKDKKIKIMDELIKTNQKHIEHLKQTITQLKKQLQFEQKRNLDLEKDNIDLKAQIKRFKQPTHSQGTQTLQQISFGAQLQRKDSLQLSAKKAEKALEAIKIGEQLTSDIQIQQQISPAKKKLDLKIDVSQALKRQQSGPISSVKKSSTYLHGLTDAKLIDAIKERIPEKSYRNGLYSSDKINRKSLLFSFQNKSTVFEKHSTEDFDHQSQKQRDSEGKKEKDNNLFESILEEQRADTMEVSALLQQPQKLFEKFYIMGCEKKEFLEFDNDPSIREGILPASILFKSDQEVAVYESIINGFVYPFGNQVELMKVSDSFRKLKEIMYSGNKYELLDKFSIFTIKNQDDAPDYPLINQANPEKLLYGICLSVYDYIETTPDNIELTYKNRKKRIFWRYKKTYCFLTYFPFFELFQDLLISIINLIKINRTDRYLKKYSEEYEVLKDVDGQQIIKEFQGDIQKFLQAINQVRPEQGYQLLEIQTLAGTLKYRIPNQLQMDIELRLWSANIAIQVLQYKDIITIFLAMMTEISIVLVSDKSSILTSVMHFFHHLLRPTEWTHPVIYNTPEQLLTMIQSPVPILVGVNLSETEFNSLNEDCENRLIVFLDFPTKIVFKPKTLLNEISMPYFGGILQKIEAVMKQQQSVRQASPCLRKNENNQNIKTIKFYFDDADNNRSKQVLQLFRKIFDEYLIAKLPFHEEDGIKAGDDVNFLLIENLLLQKSDVKDRKFIENLCKTQHFQYYLQMYYEE